MSGSLDKPLLTFGLVSCNQDLFVREAVDAAFMQTYAPLEIILSDDCSDDRSFEIMREMAAAYRGPHRVVLNQNPSRRRTGGHFNKVAQLAHGELIVIAAADDVSLPHRTQVVYDAWRQTGSSATSIYSDVIQIDESGATIEQVYKGEKPGKAGEAVELRIQPSDYVHTLKPAVHGCSHVISPSLFKMFGDMPDHVMYEDKVLALRSVLGGRLIYINEPLVRYRLHGANVFKYRKRAEDGADLKILEGQENRLLRDFRETETMYGAFIQDLETALKQKMIEPADFDKMMKECDKQRGRAVFMGDFLESCFLHKCLKLRQFKGAGMDHDDQTLLLKRLMPRRLFLQIRLARSRAATASQSGVVRVAAL